MNEFKLRSFLYHPQLKSGHPNEETKKLTNHATGGTSIGTSGVSSGTVNTGMASQISKSFSSYNAGHGK